MPTTAKAFLRIYNKTGGHILLDIKIEAIVKDNVVLME
jgi:hypothetical protein